MFIKGTVSRDFLLQVFSMNHLPPSPYKNIRIISNFFENSRRYSQVKVQCQRHCWQICHRHQWHQRQILPPVPLVLLTPVANLPPVSTITAALPPVSTTPVANCHRYQRHQRQICDRCQRHQRQICDRCQRHRWQIMGTISGCRHLTVNLKTQIYIHVNSTTQRCPNKIIKIFRPSTPVVYLEPRISARIFEKNRNGRNGILRCLGETDPWKKLEVENLVTLSLLAIV